MKKILVILCLLCLAPASYAVLDRNYFEYDLTPSGEYVEEDAKQQVTTTTTTTVTQDDKNSKDQKKTKIKRKRRGLWGTGSSQSNTYWDFGHPDFGYSGGIQ